jgi:hypothetical protein
MTATTARKTPTRADDGPRRIFAVLTGLTALAVLLQGLWAGIFLEHDGERDEAESWIEVHALDGEVAIGLAVLAVAWALFRLRHRRDLLVGAIVLALLLALEAFLGGLIADAEKDTLTPVHIPLALAIMALAVWLSLRATRSVPGPSSA